MIHFVHPEVFLLAVPGAVWLLRCGRGLAVEVHALRFVLFALLLAVLAEPFRATATAGRDLLLLVDRSRSVGELGWRRAGELAQDAMAAAEPGDRIGVLSFGRRVAVEVPLTEAPDFVFGAPRADVDGDATDLLAAIDRAVAAVPPGRRGSIVVVSDGEGTGAPAWPGARAALRRGVRIDAVPIRRPAGAEVAVEELELPAEVAPGEPLRITGWVQADRALAAPYRLLRDGQTLAEGTVDLRPGSNRLRFRDRAAGTGTHAYELVLDVPEDRVRENDRALGVVRVAGPRPILVVRQSGDPGGRLPSVLRAAGLGVEVVTPGRAPASLGALDAFRAVVLEDVPAADLPAGAMEALASFVEDFGGGLWMTGGKASFGLGGYRFSPLEPVLPVTMEVREEQRRFALAMAIGLDRSGSMSAPAGAGRTKMDLANLGTIAALQTLGPNDEIAVLAVDSAPHVVVPLTRIDQGGDLASSIRDIESGGGGIFVEEALQAMAAQLASTTTANRHMVLFADAADAEEPGAYRSFVPGLVQAGVTLSVIALGTPTDSDAALLLELARLGGGRCKFVEDVRELPRLFAQETIEVARSSFVEEQVPVRVRPGLVGLGDLAIAALSSGAIPPVGGHAIAWAEPRASVGLALDDETETPLLTFWQRGLGRAAAYLGEVDGDFTGPIGAFAGFDELLATTGRWVGGAEAAADVWAEVRREGHEAVVRVELAADASADAVERLRAARVGPDGAQPLWLERTGLREFEARFALEREGVYRVVVQAGEDHVLRLAPVSLPYSPEFEPRVDPGEGRRTLARLAEIAEGQIDPPSSSLLAGPRDSLGIESLGMPLAWMALVLLVLEVAVRRLGLQLPALGRVQRLVIAGVRRVSQRSRSAEVESPAAPVAPRHASSEEAGDSPVAAAPPSPTPEPLSSVLDRARRRAQGGR
jgi:hypothetical protein